MFCRVAKTTRRFAPSPSSLGWLALLGSRWGHAGHSCADLCRACHPKRRGACAYRSLACGCCCEDPCSSRSPCSFGSLHRYSRAVALDLDLIYRVACVWHDKGRRRHPRARFRKKKRIICRKRSVADAPRGEEEEEEEGERRKKGKAGRVLRTVYCYKREEGEEKEKRKKKKRAQQKVLEGVLRSRPPANDERIGNHLLLAPLRDPTQLAHRSRAFYPRNFSLHFRFHST